MADRSRARRRRRAVPPGSGRRVHGEADDRGLARPNLVVGERAPARGARRAARRARRRHVPRPVGWHRRRRHHRRPERDVSGPSRDVLRGRGARAYRARGNAPRGRRRRRARPATRGESCRLRRHGARPSRSHRDGRGRRSADRASTARAPVAADAAAPSSSCAIAVRSTTSACSSADARAAPA